MQTILVSKLRQILGSRIRWHLKRVVLDLLVALAGGLHALAGVVTCVHLALGYLLCVPLCFEASMRGLPPRRVRSYRQLHLLLVQWELVCIFEVFSIVLKGLLTKNLVQLIVYVLVLVHVLCIFSALRLRRLHRLERDLPPLVLCPAYQIVLSLVWNHQIVLGEVYRLLGILSDLWVESLVYLEHILEDWVELVALVDEVLFLVIFVLVFQVLV